MSSAKGVEEEAPLRIQRRFDILDAAHQEPEPRVHALRLEWFASGGEDISVSRCVDDNAGDDRLPACLVLDDDGLDRTFLYHWLAGPCLVEDANPASFTISSPL
jgi:hypothetical protein